MDLSKVNMKALAEVLGITDLTDFTIRNEDTEDGRVIIGRDTIVPHVCKDQFVLEGDGDLFFTRQCICIPSGSRPSHFDDCRPKNEFRKLDPVSQMTAGIVLSALGERLNGSFVSHYSYAIYYMQNRLGLGNDLNRLGTGT